MLVANDTLENKRKLYRYTLLVSVALITLQILDGVFTGMGIQRFGIESEGNPLLRELMLNVGPYTALAIAKLFAISCILTMAILVEKVRWVPHALMATCGIYLVFAVLPWSYYLFLNPWIETATILTQ